MPLVPSYLSYIVITKVHFILQLILYSIKGLST